MSHSKGVTREDWSPGPRLTSSGVLIPLNLPLSLGEQVGGSEGWSGVAEAPSCSGPVTPQHSAIVLPGLVNTWSAAFVPGKTPDSARPWIWKQSSGSLVVPSLGLVRTIVCLGLKEAVPLVEAFEDTWAPVLT